MSKFLQNALVAGALMTGTISVQAAIITGDLSYDTATNVITGNGKSYLGWDELAHLTYNETLAYTADNSSFQGGKYAGYHIASETEALEFYGLAITDGQTGITGQSFGDNYNILGVNPNISDYDSYAWFISSTTGQAGSIHAYLAGIEIINPDIPVLETDFYSHITAEGLGISWLLVSDGISIPEPTTLSLFGLGLLGLGFARKQKRK
ncbi:MAG: hypothetical protein COA99_00060 [Moraxellaceae bacterium]|nr:MAG: hypothetical protein COA99_00060 [Moraxellaceae bacterium]